MPGGAVATVAPKPLLGGGGMFSSSSRRDGGGGGGGASSSSSAAGAVGGGYAHGDLLHTGAAGRQWRPPAAAARHAGTVQVGRLVRLGVVAAGGQGGSTDARPRALAVGTGGGGGGGGRDSPDGRLSSQTDADPDCSLTLRELAGMADSIDWSEAPSAAWEVG